ncbi:MAG: DHA2 family efflux MFS transporter permease subunit [Bacillota bacterium]
MDTNPASEQQNGSFWLPLLVVVVGAFAAILNNSSINVALPKMMAIFGVQEDQIQWVLTAYMLTSGVVIPVTGYLGDKYGTKKIYLISVTVFTIGSVLCSIAWNNNTMIAARVVQGIGGGAIMPVSMAIVYRIVPRNMIGMALGIWGMAAVTAPAIGPTLGGYIIDHLNWRFLFSMNIPVGLSAIVLGKILLPANKPGHYEKFDFWGFITSSAGCFLLLLALSQGQKEGWDSFYIVELLTGAFFLLLLFVLIELSVPHPMLDLRLFKNRIFAISVMGASVMTIGLFGGVFLLPIFTQNLMGKTPMETGMMLMPAALVTAVLMPISGFLFDRFGARILTFTGLLVLAWGTFEFKNLSIETTVAHITLIASIRSLGMGMAMMPMTTAGMNTVPLKDVSRASALSNVCRQVGASFGVAVLTTVMQTRQAFHMARLSDSVTVGSPAATSLISQVGAMLGQGLPPGAGESQAVSIIGSLAAMQATVMAIDDTFIVAAMIIIVGIPTALFLGKGGKKPSPGM